MTTIDTPERSVELGNPDKVLFPDVGLTKRDLAEHYLRVADLALPHLRGRPLTMERHPDGIEASGFVQKEAPGHFPDWIRTVTVPKEGGEVTHVVCDDAATLVYLVDQACITPHVWLSTTDHLDRPDRLVVDLDPPRGADDPEPVRFAARAVRDVLDELDLSSRLMTTGSKGVHLIVPLDGQLGFDEVRGLARRIAGVAAGRHDDRLTIAQRTDARRGRVFLDILRNGYAQTTVAPYAVRTRPGAPVATPIDWDELGRVTPRRYTVSNLARRLGQKDDPWHDDGIGPQSLDDVAARLDDLEA
ncbi:MAG TPA: non-homologous end-joining DNA ligase [Acidimicrobiales bacterium]|nr:non-homologous end-joining DNA ligase [Acidimicrobiales bacterium]